MTNAIDPRDQHGTASTNPEPPLTECPSWCGIQSGGHVTDYDGEDPRTGLLQRLHAIEYDQITAESDPGAPDQREQPNAFVNISGVETVTEATRELAPLTVAVETTGYPHFTPVEARRLAALLTRAADRVDQIASAR